MTVPSEFSPLYALGVVPATGLTLAAAFAEGVAPTPGAYISVRKRDPASGGLAREDLVTTTGAEIIATVQYAPDFHVWDPSVFPEIP